MEDVLKKPRPLQKMGIHKGSNIEVVNRIFDDC